MRSLREVLFYCLLTNALVCESKEKSADSQMGKGFWYMPGIVCDQLHPPDHKIVTWSTLPIIENMGRDEAENIEKPTKTSDFNGYSRRNEAEKLQQISIKP